MKVAPSGSWRPLSVHVRLASKPKSRSSRAGLSRDTRGLLHRQGGSTRVNRWAVDQHAHHRPDPCPVPTGLCTAPPSGGHGMNPSTSSPAHPPRLPSNLGSSLPRTWWSLRVAPDTPPYLDTPWRAAAAGCSWCIGRLLLAPQGNFVLCHCLPS